MRGLVCRTNTVSHRGIAAGQQSGSSPLNILPTTNRGTVKYANLLETLMKYNLFFPNKWNVALKEQGPQPRQAGFLHACGKVVIFEPCDNQPPPPPRQWTCHRANHGFSLDPGHSSKRSCSFVSAVSLIPFPPAFAARLTSI